MVNWPNRLLVPLRHNDMPELPEVETIARNLQTVLSGRIILAAELYWERSLIVPSPSQFRRLVPSTEIVSLSRRAKYLDILLAFPHSFRKPTRHLIFHLGMSGDLLTVLGGYQVGQHDRLLLRLSEDAILVFNDPRKFGRVWLIDDPGVIFSRLGPEPLSDDFTPEQLFSAFHRRRRQLKPLLLDQSFLAGLGNIYTDEALFLARLHPLRCSDTLTGEETAQLHAAIRQVLEEGIAYHGASIDWVYRGGEFQNHFRVYGRIGKPCPRCGTTIERTLIGRRGTYFCPLCQRRQD